MLDRILVVDDEPDVTGLVAWHLGQAGFNVITAADGLSALAQVQTQTPALIVLDLMLPDLDGIEVTRRLKADKTTMSIPILMLTARVSEADRVRGFELGADDYMTKPFSPRELAVRIKRILQGYRNRTARAETVKHGRVILDFAKHEVCVDGEPVDLTISEFKLLHALLLGGSRVQTRPQLLDRAYGDDRTRVVRTIDLHIRRIRQKLGRAGNSIETVYGLGYRMADGDLPRKTRT